MNKNIFNSAIRDVRNSTKNKSSKLNLLNKKIGKEFTEEIDFEKESIKNLGEDRTCQEETNEKFNMNK